MSYETETISAKSDKAQKNIRKLTVRRSLEAIQLSLRCCQGRPVGVGISAVMQLKASTNLSTATVAALL